SCGRGNPPRYLIHELLRCSAPFPFRELHLDSDNDANPAEDPDKDLPEEKKRPAWATPSKVAKRSPDDELQSEGAPDADIATIQVFLPGDRFDDIAGKEIIRTPKEQCHYKSAHLRRPQGLDALGTGEAGYEENGIGPLRAELERSASKVKRSDALPASFESLLEVVEAANRLVGVTARIREPTDATGLLRLTEPASQRQWAYLDSAKKIRRRVMIVDFACEESHGCVIEYERRQSERSRLALFISRESARIPDGVLLQLLDELVSAEGVWIRMKRCPSGLGLVLFNHSRPSAVKFAADLRAALLSDVVHG